MGFLYDVGDGSCSLVDVEVKGDSWRSPLRRVFEIVTLSYGIDDTHNRTPAAMLLGRKGSFVATESYKVATSLRHD
jgi:hypothetical protein